MERFEMVAKTFQGLENVLAEELRDLGAENVEPGKRMVSFEGDLEMLYRANLCCRTALSVLKPFYKFYASDPDELYDRAKEYDWGSLLTPEKTFSIDSTVHSDDFTHSKYAVYRVKDAIVDWFRDHRNDGKRPGVRLSDADVIINLHISDDRVTLSLNSSGESLHKRGYRVEQTDAPINEVLAAGIILMSGWRGDVPFVDPMCGSGTFLIEAAMIAANIMPGVYRRNFAFERWGDFDAELFESLYNDDSAEREVRVPIVGADVLQQAIAISRANIKSAGLTKYITLECKDIASWQPGDAPEGGVLVTNPPYGERLKPEDLEGLYAQLGTKLKFVFKGYHAWVIGAVGGVRGEGDAFDKIGLAPSQRVALVNGKIDCELREFIIFDGDYRSFRREGGSIRREERHERAGGPRKMRSDERGRRDERGKKDERRGKPTGGAGRFDDKGRKGTRRHDDEEPRQRRSEGKLTPEQISERRRKWLERAASDPRKPTLQPEKPTMRTRGWRRKEEE